MHQFTKHWNNFAGHCIINNSKQQTCPNQAEQCHLSANTAFGEDYYQPGTQGYMKCLSIQINILRRSNWQDFWHPTRASFTQTKTLVYLRNVYLVFYDLAFAFSELCNFDDAQIAWLFLQLPSCPSRNPADFCFSPSFR